MIFYQVDSEVGTFNRQEVIDEYISAIWTERFIEAGDVTIVMPAAHKQLKLLAPGNLLGCQGSRELMLLETRSIENGLVTATGKTLEAYFNQRLIPAIFMVGKGADIMKSIVNLMQDREISNTSQRIPGLRVDDPDPNEAGRLWNEDVPSGAVYDILVNYGKKYSVGQSVVWTKIEDGDHELVYTTRRGQDLTGSVDNGVRFSPKLDNLANVKQLSSIADYKNIVIVKLPTWLTDEDRSLVEGIILWNYQDDPSIFNYRYMEVDGSDIAEDDLKPYANDPEKIGKLYNILGNRQEQALREHKKTKVVDGEITLESQFVYKTDYNLGDIVEVEGNFGDPIKGTITEYIRSIDETGSRNYPTMVSGADPPASAPT